MISVKVKRSTHGNHDEITIKGSIAKSVTIPHASIKKPSHPTDRKYFINLKYHYVVAVSKTNPRVGSIKFTKPKHVKSLVVHNMLKWTSDELREIELEEAITDALNKTFDIGDSNRLNYQISDLQRALWVLGLTAQSNDHIVMVFHSDKDLTLIELEKRIHKLSPSLIKEAILD
jgi:hypothetical protein